MMTKDEFNRIAEESTSVFDIDLDAVKRNVARIQRFIGPEHRLIGVVKGNAYGFGLEEMAHLLTTECGVELLAVAHVAEGIQLRKAGIQCGILVMSAIPERLVAAAYAYDLQIPVFGGRIIEALEKEGAARNQTLKVHVKIETGMNRMGVHPGEELREVISKLKNAGHLDVYGVYTHFATSRIYDNAFTKEQLARFRQGLAQLEQADLHPVCIHAANSGAIMWLPDSYFTHVRSASLMIGYARLKEHPQSNPVQVEEVAAWRTSVTHIYEVQPGESIGYGRHFVAEKPTRVALAAVGNCDGVIRDVALHYGPVLLNGKRTKYLGVCMDQCFIDVTDLACEVGDIVTVFGADGSAYLSPLELVSYAPNMTCSQCFSTIGPRVKRNYIHNHHGKCQPSLL